MTERPESGRSTVLASAGWRWRCSTRADGDFHIEQPADALERTRRRFVDLPWTMLDEVHGTVVRHVRTPGEHDGLVGDALVTDLSGAVLGIWVGDCAPVGFASADGRIGAAHAGWKGIEAGVLQATVAAMRRDPSTPITAVLGPCIHPCCYEFGAADLDRLVDRYGAAVRGITRTGRPALDVPAAVRAALAEVDVELTELTELTELPDGESGCTGCDGDWWFSHRVRGERGRQVMAVWKEVA